MKKIPLLDMKAQIKPIRKEINNAIGRVIDSGNFILGEETKLFEEELSKYCGVAYAIGVSNGTDAIALALEALGINREDEVICPAFTYYATAGAIVRIGAKPVFVDIDPKTYCIDVYMLKSYLQQAQAGRQKMPKAVIAVHIYGQCADMNEILKIAGEHNLKVIEDTAQAFGASYNDKRAGTMSDCGTVSFFPAKNLGAFGDAGMILTNNKAAADKIRLLRNQGASPENKYNHSALGHNNRLDAIQAAVLRVKLNHLDKWNRQRAQNADYYNERFKNTGLVTPYVFVRNIHIYHQYVLRARDKEQRDKIVRHLGDKGIDARTYYPIPLHLQPCFQYLGYKAKDMPASERCAEETFAIPVYPELTKRRMDYVVNAVKQGLRA